MAATSPKTLPSTMQSAIVFSGPSVTLRQTTLPPLPRSQQLLIRTIFVSSNPKDWKRPTLMNQPPWNQGDDVAGIVAATEPDVTDFKVGDRVAALHQPGAEWGTYAEYCLVWSYAAFRIPENTGFAEASTIPMAAVTAAVGLYRVLGVAFPEVEARPLSLGSESILKGKEQPLIIYGASSAVGAFAFKLASLSGLHPIIAVSGAGSEYVRTLLDEDKGDMVVDYRSGEAQVVEALTSVLQSQGLVADLAFDTVPDASSQRLLGKLLAASSSGQRQKPEHLASVLPPPNVEGFPEGVKRTFVMSPVIFQTDDTVEGDKEANHAFGKKVMHLLTDALQERNFTGHPFEIIPGGLEGIQTGLENLQGGRNSAKKYVYEIGGQ